MVGIDQSENSDFKFHVQGVFRFHNQSYVPDDAEMKKVILEERHRSKLSTSGSYKNVSRFEEFVFVA